MDQNPERSEQVEVINRSQRPHRNGNRHASDWTYCATLTMWSYMINQLPLPPPIPQGQTTLSHHPSYQ